MELKLTKCKSRETADSCENVQKFKVGKYCELLTAKNQPWTPIFDNAQPRLTCPFKKVKVEVHLNIFQTIQHISRAPFLSEMQPLMEAHSV